MNVYFTNLFLFNFCSFPVWDQTNNPLTSAASMEQLNFRWDAGDEKRGEFNGWREKEKAKQKLAQCAVVYGFEHIGQFLQHLIDGTYDGSYVGDPQRL
jgi:hypothetical protein